MPVAIELRKAQPADAAAVAAVYLGSWRAGYRELLTSGVLNEQARLRANRDWLAPIESSTTAVIVAIQNDAVVGVVQADDGHLAEGARDLPEITMLYVTRPHRGEVRPRDNCWRPGSPGYGSVAMTRHASAWLNGKDEPGGSTREKVGSSTISRLTPTDCSRSCTTGAIWWTPRPAHNYGSARSGSGNLYGSAY